MCFNTVARQNHSGDVGEKGKGTPVAFIMDSYRKHPSYATTSCISQPAYWLCFGSVPHADLYFSPNCSRAVSPISVFYWFMPCCLILQGLRVRTGSSRIQGNQRDNVLEFKKTPKIVSFQLLPTNVVRLMSEE